MTMTVPLPTRYDLDVRDANAATEIILWCRENLKSGEWTLTPMDLIPLWYRFIFYDNDVKLYVALKFL